MIPKALWTVAAVAVVSGLVGGTYGLFQALFGPVEHLSANSFFALVTSVSALAVTLPSMWVAYRLTHGRWFNRPEDS